MSKVDAQDSRFRFQSSALINRDRAELSQVLGKTVSGTSPTNSTAVGDVVTFSVTQPQRPEIIAANRPTPQILETARTAIEVAAARLSQRAEDATTTPLSPEATKRFVPEKAEVEARAAERAVPLSEGWDEASAALVDVASRQLDVIEELSQKPLSQSRRAALDQEFTALTQEYNRVYEALFGASAPPTSWTTPSGFEIGLSKGLSFTATTITSDFLSVSAGTGTPVSLVEQTDQTLSDGSGGAGTVLTVGADSITTLQETGTADSFDLNLANAVSIDTGGQAIDLGTETVGNFYGGNAKVQFDGLSNPYDGGSSLGTRDIDLDDPTAIDATTDTITLTSGGSVTNGNRIRLSGSLPGGLSSGTDYFVIDASGSSFRLSANRDGTGLIDITSGGTGTMTVEEFSLPLYDPSTNESGVYSNLGYRIKITDGTPPPGLSLDTVYYTFYENYLGKLAASYDDAYNGIEVDITGYATGTYNLQYLSDIDITTDTIFGLNYYGTGNSLTIGAAWEPGGLTSGNTYYVIRLDDYRIQLASSFENALDGTEIDITSTGDMGQNYMYMYSPGQELVNTSTDTIFTGYYSPNFSTGSRIRLQPTSDSQLPTGIDSYTDYYVIRVDENEFKLATSASNAALGVAVDLTGFGFGDIIYTLYSQANSPVSLSTDTITLSNHGFTNNQLVAVSSSATLPGGLTAGNYYVKYADANSFQLSATSGGAAIDLTSTGSGTLTISPTQSEPIDASTDLFHATAHGFTTGQVVQITGTGNAPSGLSKNQNYYVIASSADTFKLAASATDATNGTAIDILNAGTGTISVGSESPAIDTANDTISLTNHGLTFGTRVQVSSTGSLPSGLTSGQDYYVKVVDSNTIQLLSSLSVDSAASPVNFGSGGTGILTLTTYADTPFDATANEITQVGNSYTTGQRIQLSGSGTPPTGLAKDTDYYVITTSDPNKFKLASSYADALSDTAIDFSGNLSGALQIAAFSDVSVASNTISVADHGLATGTVVRIQSAGTPPGGLSEDTDYYVINVDNNTFRLATSAANASNGVAIDITSEPSDVFRVYVGSTTAEGRVESDLNLTSAAADLTRIVSTSSTGALGNANPSGVEVIQVSKDGRFVLMESWASNLVTGDTSGSQSGRADIFLKDTVTGVMTRVNTTSSGGQESTTGGAYVGSAMSSNGRFVVFWTDSSNLVADDSNGVSDVFLKDTVTGQVTLVSTSSTGVQGNALSAAKAVSDDGRYVLFYSGASNLVADDTNGVPDIFVKDLQTGNVERVNTSSAGAQADYGSWSSAVGMSADGRYIIFDSNSANLVAGDTNTTTDVFMKDRVTGVTTRVNTDSSGNQVEWSASTWGSDVSADGRYVVFSSTSTTLVADDTNDARDVFVKDTVTGATTRVSTDSLGAESDGVSYNGSISDDGRFVAFWSGATNLVSGDTNGSYDSFRKDLLTGDTIRVNTSSSGDQDSGGDSFRPQISGDGRFVAFTSMDPFDTGDTTSSADIYLKDVSGAAPFDSSTDAITYNDHGLSTGQVVRFSGAGTLPTGLAVDTNYYAISTGANTFKVASTYEDAIASTSIDFSGSASGGIALEALRVDVANERITFAGHGFSTGDKVRISSTDILPSGYSRDTDYYVIADDANNLRLATSESNASAGTAVQISSMGTGILSIVPVGSGSGPSAFDPTTDEVALTGHNFASGTRVRLSGAGTAPTGLSKDTDYYVINTGNANSFKLASSLSNALANSAINFTSASTGTLTLSSFSAEAAFNAAANTIQVAGSNVATGQRLQFSGSGATVPTGISIGVDYYAIAVDANSFRIASSLANALSATAIDFSGSASGNIQVTMLGSSNFDPAGDTITITGNTLTTGQRVRVSPNTTSYGYLPTDLTNRDYYVIKGAGDTIKLAASLLDAQNGVSVNFSGAGAGSILVEAFSESTQSSSSGLQGSYDTSTRLGLTSAQSTIDSIANNLEMLRVQARTANTRTQSIAAYSRSR